MPELPEVEHLRRTLDPWIVGAEIVTVDVRRRDVVACPSHTRLTSQALQDSLGLHSRIVGTLRHGKQLALECANGRAIVIQLGMTGGVLLEQGDPLPDALALHRHVVWGIRPAPLSGEQTIPVGAKAGSRQRASGSNGQSPLWHLHFRDPRRFGKITGLESSEQLREFWTHLGPDALTIRSADLFEALQRTKRPVKSALLDQSLIAGVGNIYADEALFIAKVHPFRPAAGVSQAEASALARSIRSILSAAVKRGGSTLRDYRDAFNQPGSAVALHKVYARSGKPCVACASTLIGERLQGRATVYCPCCQDLSPILRRL